METLRSHIAVIDPAVKQPELETLAHLSSWSSLPISYSLPALYGMESIHRVDENAAAIIVLGSLASVNEKYAWQSELSRWLKSRMDGGTPTLGICYGHQLVAALYGGKVGFVQKSKVKLQGVRRVVLNANSLWGDPLDGPLCVAHNEMVVSAPDSMDIVGHSEAVAIDALHHRRLPVWSFQSHPEATQAFFDNRKLAVPTGDVFSFGHGLIKRFLDFAANRR